MLSALWRVNTAERPDEAMSRRLHELRRRLAPFARPVREAGRWLLYLPQRLLGRPAGSMAYAFEPWRPAGPLHVELHLRGEGPGAVTREAADAWCAAQTLRELTALGYDASGRLLWRLGGDGEPADEASGAPALYFAAPGRLPEVYPAFLESAVLVAAAEAIDAVLLRERLPDAGGAAAEPADLLTADLRPYVLWSAAAYDYDAAGDEVRPRGGRRLVKVIDAAGVGGPPPRDRVHFGARRRGPYLASEPLPPTLRVGVRDVAALTRQALPGRRPRVLVLLSFLAHGGVEHTLYETLLKLKDDFELTIVTLAPHRPELGDRRQDFRRITERLYCLGDLLHPAAMYGILLSLIDQTGTEVLFNTNGTTLFYEIAPRLKAERPQVRIIDQLYDYRVGYITWYDERIKASVDTCVAVNRRIAETLVADYGWPPERVPVIWPCGRRREAFPDAEEAAALRRELGYDDEDVVFLTAARMNAQKRPLDLVALAARLRDLPRAKFLIAGGGELDGEVDAAIEAAAGARIRRLGFRDDVPRLVMAADVGCLVSDFEGLPVFMMECLQGGRPFLGTDVGEMGDVLRSTGAGLVVDRPGDLAALEAAARRLCDGETRRRLAERAAEAAAPFEVETCARSYGELFAGRL